MKTEKGTGAAAHIKNRMVAAKKETLRDYLSSRGLLEKVIEYNEKIADLATFMPPENLARLKVAIETNLKLSNKYLPDLRQTEIIGDPDQPLSINNLSDAQLEAIATSSD